MSEAKHVKGPITIKFPDFDEAREVCDGLEDGESIGELCYATLSDPKWDRFAKVVVVVNGDEDDQGVATAKLFVAAPELLAGLEAPTWLVWSNYHKAWWGPDRSQYYYDINSAGRYTLEEAMRISAIRGVERGVGSNPPEMIQPSPEWLAARAAAILKAKGGAA